MKIRDIANKLIGKVSSLLPKKKLSKVEKKSPTKEEKLREILKDELDKIYIRYIPPIKDSLEINRFNHELSNDFNWEKDHREYVQKYNVYGHDECLVCNREKLANSGNRYFHIRHTNYPDYKPVYDPILPDEGEVLLMGVTAYRNCSSDSSMKGAYSCNGVEFSRKLNELKSKISDPKEISQRRASEAELKRVLHNKMIKDHMTHEDTFIRLVNNKKANEEC